MKQQALKYKTDSISVFFCYLFFLWSTACVLGAVYGGGSGTELDPYVISTPQQLNAIGTDPNDWDKFFVQTVDIDMSIFAGTEYNVIGDRDTGFTGSFDGGGFTISNLTCVSAGDKLYAGLFGYASNGAVFKNINLKQVFISNAGRYAGGLVGYLSSGSISNCCSIGQVNVESSASSAYAGILAGNLSSSNITNCDSAGSAYASGSFFAHAGGLVGLFYNSTITFCFSEGLAEAITTTTDEFSEAYAGGLTGYNRYSSISDCYASGSVSAEARGVDSIAYVGGLAGREYGSSSTIDRCYSIGGALAVADSPYAGGLIGEQSFGSVSASFWDTQASSLSSSAGGTGVTGMTTAQMMQSANFTVQYWDFSDDDGDNADWMMLREGEDYPRLAWQPIYRGDIAGLYGVDLVDFEELARNWLETDCPAGCEEADLEPIGGDGIVNINDLFTLLDEWLK